MDPLDLLFNNLSKGEPIPSFSIGYSIGMTKGVAAIAITYAVVKLKLENPEIQTIKAELVALLAMKATCDPAGDVEEQVNRSISRKIRASERPRPQVLQLHFAFERTMHSKKSKGDRRQDTALLGAVIKTYNTSQISKNRVTADEREAVLFLHGQTLAFKNKLEVHWNNFPSPYSVVPVSFLAKSFLNDTFEPPVKRNTHPEMHAALTGSNEKRELWLDRVIGKYMKSLVDAKATGKAVNVKSLGSTFRSGNDDAMVRHTAFLFESFKDDIQAVVSKAGWKELEARHARGTLDRELIEKVRSPDDTVTAHDFRFVQMMADYKGPACAAVNQNPLQAAEFSKQTSELQLDMLLLTNEAKTWSLYLADLRAFHADTHNDKTNEMQAHIQVLHAY